MVVSGQRILRLVAVGADGRHVLGVRFGDLVPSGIYRATAWIKAEPGVRVMIEARDSVEANTGKPSNYGVAQFDLAARSAVNSTGDIISSGAEAATDDWVKVWVDFRSSDGQIFALIGLLEGSNNRHVFTPAGQSVMFGGFEISPPRPVQASLRASIHTPPTDIGELPPLSDSTFGPDRWDLIDGLSAEAVEQAVVVSGQRILRLVAVGADGRHVLGVRFGDLVPSGIYRATAWIKAEPGVRVMIEARDSVEANTGKPSNYGVAQFDLAARSAVNSTGDIISSGAEAATDDWVKVWVDFRSSDGQIFALIGLLEGSNNRHVFTPAGQSVMFGGFEISPPRPVQASLRASIHTPPTDIGELPPLSDSTFGPDRWDLIDGLSAEAVEQAVVVSGQRILRLVAVGADGRHVLGVRFGDLVPSGIYRATAWIKAEPGVRVMIEARDSVEANTGKPSNYGVAQFDLAARSAVNSTGDIISSGAEAATDDWVKVWVDFRSSDGQIFALIGLLEGSNNRHVFTPAGQSVMFGGFESVPRP